MARSIFAKSCFEIYITVSLVLDVGASLAKYLISSVVNLVASTSLVKIIKSLQYRSDTKFVSSLKFRPRMNLVAIIFIRSLMFDISELFEVLAAVLLLFPIFLSLLFLL